MATNPPATKCWVCGRPNDYRVIPRYRSPGSPVVFGPTDYELVPHEHTQAEVDAWVATIKVEKPRPFFTKINQSN